MATFCQIKMWLVMLFVLFVDDSASTYDSLYGLLGESDMHEWIQRDVHRRLMKFLQRVEESELHGDLGVLVDGLFCGTHTMWD